MNPEMTDSMDRTKVTEEEVTERTDETDETNVTEEMALWVIDGVAQRKEVHEAYDREAA